MDDLCYYLDAASAITASTSAAETTPDVNAASMAAALAWCRARLSRCCCLRLEPPEEFLRTGITGCFAFASARSLRFILAWGLFFDARLTIEGVAVRAILVHVIDFEILGHSAYFLVLVLTL
jgi:hypothetical protein